MLPSYKYPWNIFELIQPILDIWTWRFLLLEYFSIRVLPRECHIVIFKISLGSWISCYYPLYFFRINIDTLVYLWMLWFCTLVRMALRFVHGMYQSYLMTCTSHVCILNRCLRNLKKITFICCTCRIPLCDISLLLWQSKR